MSRPIALAVKFIHTAPEGIVRLRFDVDCTITEINENSILKNLYDQSKKDYYQGWKDCEEHMKKKENK